MRLAKGLIPLILVAAIGAGCGPKEDSYGAKDIAVKQEGSGPPPMHAPMGEGK